MAFLGRSRKDDLRMLTTELGLAPSHNLKIIELKYLITNCDRYYEEFVKDVLSVIVEERTATEKQKAAELEEKQKAVVVAQQREKEFELEEMKIQLEKKNPDSTWRDFYFELSSYFEGWIKELKITTFDQLKSLIIADQIKRKTSENIKEHFLDISVDLNDPLELAEKLDAYDSLRHGMKSNSNHTFKKKEEFRKPFLNLLEDPMNTTHLDPLEQCLDSQVTKLKEETR
ncbi:CCHC-type domain-containing protein [Trichonephila clavipes]|nr:CCHC-type domain-containing protein [Trichonephila clavipes]